MRGENNFGYSRNRKANFAYESMRTPGTGKNDVSTIDGFDDQSE